MSASLTVTRSRSSTLLRTVTTCRRHSTGIDSKRYRYRLSTSDIASYEKNGYLNVRRLFNQDEISLLIDAVNNDRTASNMSMHMKDGDGRISRCTLWRNHDEDNIYNMFSRNRSLVQCAEDLIGGQEPYIIHSKLMLKEPFIGGRWEWHQDFGYWYKCGCLDPHQMMSVIIAIDKADVTNGCLQVLQGSHQLGRIEHKASGEQAGADKRFVDKMIESGRFENVCCEMEPGDVLFTHSNLFHSSEPNESEKWRRYLIVAFNGKHNEPWKEMEKLMPLYQRIDIVDDDAIMKVGNKGFEGKEAVHDFLDHETNLAFARDD